jgi:hypothetical protein
MAKGHTRSYLRYRISDNSLVIGLSCEEYERYREEWQVYAANLRVRGFRVVLPSMMSRWLSLSSLEVVITT